MGVSFLSTIPPLLPLGPVPSLITTTTNRYPSYAVSFPCLSESDCLKKESTYYIVFWCGWVYYSIICIYMRIGLQLYHMLLLHSYVKYVCVVSNCLILQLCLLTLIVKKYQVTVRCNKMEIDATAVDEDRFCRRDILKCAGVTIGMVRALLLYLNHKFCLYQFHFFGSGFWNSSNWMNLAVYSITYFK